MEGRRLNLFIILDLGQLEDVERTRPAGDFSKQPWRKEEGGAGKCMRYGSCDDHILESAGSYKRAVLRSPTKGLACVLFHAC